MRTLRIATLLVFALLYSPEGFGQKGDDWQRVITGAGLNIDVSMGSLRLEPGRALSARFKTTLSKPENVPGTSSGKYKARLETILFDAVDDRYRIKETTFLNSSGKIVHMSSSDDWKPIRGNTAFRLYNKAKALPPFGVWNVITYRYADGKVAASDDPEDLRKLLGSSLVLEFDAIRLAGKSCYLPSFQVKGVTDNEFIERTGHPLKAIGIDGATVDAVILVCGSERSDLKQTFFLPLSDGKLLLLWDGVFLELMSPKDSWSTSLLKLISNQD